jgi:ABC-type transporter Mla subunit MlaD
MSKANQIHKVMQMAFVSSLVVMSIGCGKAKTLSDSPTVANVQDMPEMKAIDDKVQALDVQTRDVIQQINGFGLQNPLSLFSGALTGSLTQFSGLSLDLTSKIDDLKAKLNAQIAQLNASNPQQAQMIAQLQNILGNLDQVTDRLKEVVAQLQSKINAVFDKLEAKIARIGGIQGIVAQMILEKVKSAVLKKLPLGI